MFVDPVLLDGYPKLSSKIFRVNMLKFGHASYELSTICGIFFITYKTNKTQINNLIHQLLELNLDRLRY